MLLPRSCSFICHWWPRGSISLCHVQAAQQSNRALLMRAVQLVAVSAENQVACVSGAGGECHNLDKNLLRMLAINRSVFVINAAFFP